MACIRHGTFKDQEFDTCSMPSVTAADNIAPQYHAVWYIAVSAPRWTGCAISVTKDGAADCISPPPAPSMTRVPKRTHGYGRTVCTIAAIIMMIQPIPTFGFRPNLSAMYEAGMNEHIPPRAIPPEMRPITESSAWAMFLVTRKCVRIPILAPTKRTFSKLANLHSGRLNRPFIRLIL